MKPNQYDLAVFGSSPQAQVLAALIAENQARRVLLVHNPASQVPLMRALDLSVGPIARPARWRQLRRGVEETQRIFAAAGLGTCLEHCDLVLMRDGAAGEAALGHVRALAGAHGLAVERLAVPAGGDREQAGAAIQALIWRDAMRFDAARAYPKFAEWHERAGVARVGIGEVEELMISRDGSVRLSARGEPMAADAVVLADDEAVLAHANAPDIAGRLATIAMTGFLTEPVKTRLPGRAAVVVGEGFAALQHASGVLSAFGEGAGGRLAEQMLGHLTGLEDVRLAGRSRYSALGSTDGAPVVGRGRTRRTWIVGGLGTTGLFEMVSLARFVAGQSDAGETDFWRAHALSRESGRVDDLAVTAAAEAA